MRLRGKVLVLLVIGMMLLAALSVQTAYAETPEPTPSWVYKGSSVGVSAYAYATCWIRGTIYPYKYIGGATGTKASKACYRISTQCTVQQMNMSTGAWYNAWVYTAKTYSNSALVRFATPNPGGPYVDGRYAWRARARNSGYIWVASPALPFKFTQYSSAIPY